MILNLDLGEDRRQMLLWLRLDLPIELRWRNDREWLPLGSNSQLDMKPLWINLMTVWEDGREFGAFARLKPRDDP